MPQGSRKHRRGGCGCNARVVIAASIGVFALVQIFQLNDSDVLQHLNLRDSRPLPPPVPPLPPFPPALVFEEPPVEKPRAEAATTLRSSSPPPTRPSRPLPKCNYSVGSGAATYGNSDESWASARGRGVSRYKAGTAVAVYMHIFKSGGTSVCSHVRRMNHTRAPPEPGPGDLEGWERRDRRRRHRVKLTDPRPNGNCNAPLGFLPARGPMRIDAAETLGWQFVAVEFDSLPALESDLLSPECAVWSIQLRDPRNRLMSHFYHAQDHFQCLIKNTGRCAGPAHRWMAMQEGWGPPDRQNPKFRPLVAMDRRGRESFASASFRAFARWVVGGGQRLLGPAHPLAPLISGDFAARHLCGFDACAPGECGDECLEVAKARLRNMFSVVLITEGLRDWGYSALHEVLGWPPLYQPNSSTPSQDPAFKNVYHGRTHSEGHYNRNTRNEGCSSKGKGCSARDVLDEGTYQALSRLLRVDVELYEYAKALAAERHGHGAANGKNGSNTTKW